MIKIMVEYNKRFVEVDEVLSFLSEEDLLKIPYNIRQMIKDNKDEEYVWKYDPSKELKEQNLNRNTIIILSYLNMEYLLDEEQKQLMQQIHEVNEKKIEEAKSEKYSVEDLFKKNKLPKEQTKEIEHVQALMEYKETLLKKIINIIKKFFYKK